MLLKYLKAKNIILLLLILNTSGCFKYMGMCANIFNDSCKLEATFFPETLPEGTQGKPYTAVVKITGGAIPGKRSLDIDFLPINSGLKARPLNNDNSYNEIEIYGTIETLENIKIHFNGTAFSYRGFVFNKTLTIKVNPSNNHE